MPLIEQSFFAFMSVNNYFKDLLTQAFSNKAISIIDITCIFFPLSKLICLTFVHLSFHDSFFLTLKITSSSLVHFICYFSLFLSFPMQTVFCHAEESIRLCFSYFAMSNRLFAMLKNPSASASATLPWRAVFLPC